MTEKDGDKTIIDEIDDKVDNFIEDQDWIPVDTQDWLQKENIITRIINYLKQLFKKK